MSHFLKRLLEAGPQAVPGGPAAAWRQAADDIRRFGSYEVLVQPGTSRTLVISLAGIGDPQRDLMPFEWRGSIAHAAPQHHAIFIKDLARSYFNATEGFDALMAFLRGYQAAQGIAETVALGLSMGAYGAFVVGQHLKVDKVVAMSPRAGLQTPEVAFDQRLQGLIGALPQVRFPDARALAATLPDCLVMFSLDHREDTLHAGLLRGLPNVRLLATHGLHNLGSELQRRRLLVPFLQALLGGSLDAAYFGLYPPSERDFALARPQPPGAAPGRTSLGWVPAYAAQAAEVYEAHGATLLKDAALRHALGSGWSASSPPSCQGEGSLRLAVARPLAGFLHRVKVTFSVDAPVPGGHVRCVVGDELIEVPAAPGEPACVRARVRGDLALRFEIDGPARLSLREVSLFSTRKGWKR